MSRISVLTIIDKKKKYFNEYEESEIYSQIIVKNTIRSLKRELRKHKNETVIISNDSIRKPILEGKYKPYKIISKKLVLETIEKICREVALKYDLNIPLEEICVFARPEIACEYIERLIGLSRIYTIVSDFENAEVADNLYFKHGYPVRYIRKKNLKNVKESISLFIDESGASNVPAINITGEEILGRNVIDIGEISVADNSVAEISKLLSIGSGLSLYTLLEKEIPDNAIVDISKKAGIIFLLDTSAI